MFIIDDETGEIKTIHIQNDPVSPDDIREIIKILSKNQKEESANWKEHNTQGASRRERQGTEGKREKVRGMGR